MDLLKKINNQNFLITALIISLFIITLACGNGEENPDDGNNPPEDPTPKIIVDPSVTYQEMIGFGGAMTWYSDRITSSSKKDEITDLIFMDLDLDIIRLKNWYYPLNYPVDKSPDQMEVSWFKQHFDATNELFDIAKQKKPNIKVLFSSWGPPSALKSNDALNEGTLKKDNGEFMYEEYATYWEDVLNNITFSPDFLSIQNEPSYTNPGWETCEWRPSDTGAFPGYDLAFDMVYDKIKDLDNPPVMVGPESANLGNSSFGGNTFTSFASRLRDKDHCGWYAYHPYNLNESSSTIDMEASLYNLNNYQNKPNMMSEYSGMSWFKTAQFINQTLTIANTSAYIYWELMWAEDSDKAMIQVNSAGNYELTPYYFLIKQYSKHIYEGFLRVDFTSEISALEGSSFINPSGDRIVCVILNKATSSLDVKFDVTGHSLLSISVWQSTESEHYLEIPGLNSNSEVSLPAKSVTTVELDI